VTRRIFVAARGVAVAAALALAACVDQDPFGLAARGVVGGYELERFENGAYYLVGRGTSVTGGGVLDGRVERIGWDERYILAERRPDAGGDPDGWMIVDARTGAVSGPLSDAEVADNPAVQEIRALPAHQAYERLGDGAGPYLLGLGVPLAGIATILLLARWRDRRRGGASSTTAAERG